MFILPYLYHKTQLGSLWVHEWDLLTVSGTRLWKEDDGLRVKEDILDPNGLVVRSDIRVDAEQSVAFCELDASQLQMDDYYRWDELTPNELTPNELTPNELTPIKEPFEEDLFCWRRFYLFGPVDSTQPADPIQWLPTPVTQKVGPLACHDLLQSLLCYHRTQETQ